MSLYDLYRFDQYVKCKKYEKFFLFFLSKNIFYMNHDLIYKEAYSKILSVIINVLHSKLMFATSDIYIFFV